MQKSIWIESSELPLKPFAKTRLQAVPVSIHIAKPFYLGFNIEKAGKGAVNMVSEGVPISDSASVLVTRGGQGLDFTGVISIAFVIILIAVFVWLIRSRKK
ncbi:hypothetical protein D4Q76_03295 [archaeon]|nr:MAG: hypothetical protein D4Q76_03295 [archaeon]